MKNLIFFLIILFLLKSIAYSQNQPSGPIPIVKTECAYGICSLNDFVIALQNAIRVMLILGYWIAVIIALIGAFMVMLGGYRRDLLEKGKGLMINAVTSYIILLLSGILFDLLLDFLRPKVYYPS